MMNPYVRKQSPDFAARRAALPDAAHAAFAGECPADRHSADQRSGVAGAGERLRRGVPAISETGLKLKARQITSL
jgi:hypothetical protein